MNRGRDRGHRGRGREVEDHRGRRGSWGDNRWRNNRDRSEGDRRSPPPRGGEGHRGSRDNSRGSGERRSGTTSSKRVGYEYDGSDDNEHRKRGSSRRERIREELSSAELDRIRRRNEWSMKAKDRRVGFRTTAFSRMRNNIKNSNNKGRWKSGLEEFQQNSYSSSERRGSGSGKDNEDNKGTRQVRKSPPPGPQATATSSRGVTGNQKRENAETNERKEKRDVHPSAAAQRSDAHSKEVVRTSPKENVPSPVSFVVVSPGERDLEMENLVVRIEAEERTTPDPCAVRIPCKWIRIGDYKFTIPTPTTNSTSLSVLITKIGIVFTARHAKNENEIVKLAIAEDMIVRVNACFNQMPSFFVMTGLKQIYDIRKLVGLGTDAEQIGSSFEIVKHQRTLVFSTGEDCISEDQTHVIRNTFAGDIFEEIDRILAVKMLSEIEEVFKSRPKVDNVKKKPESKTAESNSGSRSHPSTAKSNNGSNVENTKRKTEGNILKQSVDSIRFQSYVPSEPSIINTDPCGSGVAGVNSTKTQNKIAEKKSNSLLISTHKIQQLVSIWIKDDRKLFSKRLSEFKEDYQKIKNQQGLVFRKLVYAIKCEVVSFDVSDWRWNSQYAGDLWMLHWMICDLLQVHDLKHADLKYVWNKMLSKSYKVLVEKSGVDNFLELVMIARILRSIYISVNRESININLDIDRPIIEKYGKPNWFKAKTEWVNNNLQREFNEIMIRKHVETEMRNSKSSSQEEGSGKTSLEKRNQTPIMPPTPIIPPTESCLATVQSSSNPLPEHPSSSGKGNPWIPPSSENPWIPPSLENPWIPPSLENPWIPPPGGFPSPWAFMLRFPPPPLGMPVPFLPPPFPAPSVPPTITIPPSPPPVTVTQRKSLVPSKTWMTQGISEVKKARKIKRHSHPEPWATIKHRPPTPPRTKDTKDSKRPRSPSPTVIVPKQIPSTPLATSLSAKRKLAGSAKSSKERQKSVRFSDVHTGNTATISDTCSTFSKPKSAKKSKPSSSLAKLIRDRFSNPIKVASKPVEPSNSNEKKHKKCETQTSAIPISTRREQLFDNPQPYKIINIFESPQAVKESCPRPVSAPSPSVHKISDFRRTNIASKVVKKYTTFRNETSRYGTVSLPNSSKPKSKTDIYLKPLDPLSLPAKATNSQKSHWGTALGLRTKGQQTLLKSSASSIPKTPGSDVQSNKISSTEESGFGTDIPFPPPFDGSKKGDVRDESKRKIERSQIRWSTIVRTNGNLQAFYLPPFSFSIIEYIDLMFSPNYDCWELTDFAGYRVLCIKLQRSDVVDSNKVEVEEPKN